MSWREVELGSVVTFIGGSQPPKSTFKYELEDGYVRLLQIRDYKSDENLTYIPIDSTKKFCSKDDVMIGRYGPPVFQILRGLEGAYNVALMKAQPSEKVDRDYLYFFLKQEKLFRLIDGLSQRTAGQSGIDMDALKSYPILLPSLDEQKRIAAILDKADAIRRKRQQATQLADDFLKSVFLDMFGDPVINPKGWDVEYWRDVLKIVNGKNQKAVEHPEGKFPICGSGGIMSYADNWLTEENSVIIGRKGNIHNPILMKKKFWNVDTAFGLEPVRSKLSHNFLFWFCKFFDFEKLNKAVTIPSLTKVDLLQISMPIPPLELQRKFDCVIEQIDRLLDKYGEVERQPIFQSLSQKAFAGEL
ncbi:restriction endonuclease subunit S [Alteromonas gracilis]|uniref:restriction endonuclease subunit S n=1 Tax=Alteromonas gracilis TaxID=1479524 RepID=UPI0030CC76DF